MIYILEKYQEILATILSPTHDPETSFKDVPGELQDLVYLYQ